MNFHIEDFSELFFKRFESFINTKSNITTEDILGFWENNYVKDTDMEIYKIQKNSYKEYDMTFRDYPFKNVFPHFISDLEKMKEAAYNLKQVLDNAQKKIDNIIEGDGEIYIIIYVGAGTGAGHVTKYKNRPAMLFGLENIANLNWHNIKTLKGLVFHELGHVIHMIEREKNCPKLTKTDKESKYGEKNEENVLEKYENLIWFRLYEEGIAQRFEHLLQGKETWHMDDQITEDGTSQWKSWIDDNYNYICNTFYNRVLNENHKLSDLFGSDRENSDCNFHGKIQVGYYIGAQMIKEWQKSLSLKKIMKLPEKDIKERVIDYLSKYK